VVGALVVATLLLCFALLGVVMWMSTKVTRDQIAHPERWRMPSLLSFFTGKDDTPKP
jgi:hypothetical protein